MDGADSGSMYFISVEGAQIRVTRRPLGRKRRKRDGERETKNRNGEEESGPMGRYADNYTGSAIHVGNSVPPRGTRRGYRAIGTRHRPPAFDDPTCWACPESGKAPSWSCPVLGRGWPRPPRSASATDRFHAVNPPFTHIYSTIIIQRTSRRFLSSVTVRSDPHSRPTQLPPLFPYVNGPSFIPCLHCVGISPV